MTIIEQSKLIVEYLIRILSDRNYILYTSRPGLSVFVACRDDHVRNKRESEMMKNLIVEMEHAVVDPGQSAKN
jgi:hypothetical protein